MNKRRFDQLVKRAANALRLGTGEYKSVMDEAASELGWVTDEPDTEWDKFTKAVDEAEAVPITAREQKKIERRQWHESVERARRNMLNAIDVYNDAKSHKRP